MKRILGLMTILLCLQFYAAGQINDPRKVKQRVQNDKDSLPAIDLFMKDRIYGLSYNLSYDQNLSFGIGYYLSA